MAQKFKPVLQARVIEEQKKADEQAALRKKYGITGTKVVQVKKEHFITSVTKVLGGIIRKGITVLLLILAFNGAVAWLHMESRRTLVYVYVDMLNQLEDLCPGVAPFIEEAKETVGDK